LSDNDLTPWVSSTSGSLTAPNAPAGGGGGGRFRQASQPGLHANSSGLAHPRAPAGKDVSWIDLRAAEAAREVRYLLKKIDAAAYEQQIIAYAKEFLGNQSFGLGVAFGLVSYPVKEVWHLLELVKTFVFADLYERVYVDDSWTAVSRAGMAGPGGVMAVLALRQFRDLRAIALPLKAAHETRDAILHELKQIILHPLDFAEALPGKIKAEYTEKWEKAVALRAQNSLSSQFEAGQIIGELLMEVLLTIAGVIEVAGVAVKLASKVPNLVRFARAGKLGEGAGAADAAAAAAAKAAEKQAAQDAKAVRLAKEADEKPPAAAKPKELPLKGISPETRALAASAEVSPAAAAARTDVVTAYLEQYGREYDAATKTYNPPTKTQVLDQLQGYDMSKPVTVGPPPPCPATQYQWQKPNGFQGSYYTDKGTAPDSVGIAGQAKDANGNIVDKVQKPYSVDPNAPYIESTAAPTNDTWSIPGQSIPTKGGGVQRTIGERSMAQAI
jgi:hypothetical protein